MSDKEGYDALWLWFGLSRASWLTLPRALMHQMPDDWQGRMAALLREWDEAHRTEDMPSPCVHGKAPNGRYVRWPEWVTNYRHPNIVAINEHRKDRRQGGE